MKNTNGVWTEEKVEQLRKLFREGLTDAQISLRLKVGRSSVIGKRNRLGLHREEPTGPRKAGKPMLQTKVWGDPDPNDPDHALDARDMQILDALVAGETPGAVAKRFKVNIDHVNELWRVREAQEPVGEDA